MPVKPYSQSKAGKAEAAKRELGKTLKRYGLESKSRRQVKLKGVGFPDYSVPDRGLPPTSDKAGNGFKRDLMYDHKWRRGELEDASTVAAIHEKAMRVQPLYSKGASQYATPNHDQTKDGRRRT